MASHPALLLIGLLMACTIAAACERAGSPQLADDHIRVATASIVTSIIPTSQDCSPFVTPSGCVNVLLRDKQVAPPPPVDPTVDGVRIWGEYDHATVLDFTDETLKSHGTIRVQATRHSWRGRVTHLKIFLEKMPFETAFGTGGSGGRFALFIDNDRFTGPDHLPGPGDRMFVLDLPANVATEFEFAAGSWQVVGPHDDFESGACAPEPSYAAITRCDAEIRISLPDSATDLFPSPNDDLIPGVGFAVAPQRLSEFLGGGTPEELKALEMSKVRLDRRQWLTLLLGRPLGLPARYMTWNIRRSEFGPLAGPYEAVPDEDIGKFLADRVQSFGAEPLDAPVVIALQEAWNGDKTAAVIAAANTYRASFGLAPLHAYGPVEHDTPALREMLSFVGGAVLGDDGANGGLWTLSSLPLAATDFHAFTPDACMGEDCMRAKGVLWTRLLLNPPEDAQPCDPSVPPAPPPGGGPPDKTTTCPPPPSGGEYVDVFNLHLQANNPMLCDAPFLVADIVAQLAFALSTVTKLPELVALNLIQELTDNDFNCLGNVEDVRALQLQQVRAFIEDVTADQPDRPVVIMGDFNIDGRTLEPEYRAMIDTLHIGPSAPSSPDLDDIINPWRFDFDWDIDHGDVAREFNSPWPSGGDCMGTFLGDNESGAHAVAPNCPQAEFVDANSRYDFILVRPRSRADSPAFAEGTAWVAERLADSPWFSPYPSLSQNDLRGPPIRLSDHKPVLVGLNHVKIQYPPKFHKDWKHLVKFRVDSLNASNQDDCWLCGDVDPYVKKFGYINGSLQYAQEGSVCDDNASVGYPQDSCTNTWYWASEHLTTNVTSHEFRARLLDEDDTSGNDTMVTSAGTVLFEHLLWNVPVLTFTGWNGQDVGIKEWKIEDTSPVPRCLGDTPTTECIVFSSEELIPGEQL